MDNRERLRVHLLLLALVLLDIVLSVVALGLPSLWFRIFHDAAYVDPQGLLRRTGAVWAAFTLLQFLALVRWTRHPHWLVLVAGVRLTELFSDWTYLLFCSTITATGRLGLLVAPPANLLFAWMLMRTYRRAEQALAKEGSASHGVPPLG